MKEKSGKCEYITNGIIYLLRIEEGEKNHYIYIKHISHLLNLATHINDKDKKICPMCNCKIPIDKFNKHISDCYKFSKNGSLLKLPEPGSVMKFENHKNKLRRPFIVYADCECTLQATNDPHLLHKHVVDSCCYYFVCDFDNTKNKLKTCKNCIDLKNALMKCNRLLK